MSDSGEKMHESGEGGEVPVKEVINDILNGIEKIIPTSTLNNSGKKESGENVGTTEDLGLSNNDLGQKRSLPDNQGSEKKQKPDNLSADAVLKDIVENSDFNSATNILDSFNGFAKNLFSDVNDFVIDTRSYINSVTGIAYKTASEIVHNTEPLINDFHEQGLIALSSAYDGYLRATGLISDVKDSLGFQNIDTIILEHEKMACIALLELVFEKKGKLIDSTTSGVDIENLITEAMRPDRSEQYYIDKRQQVLTHIEMALRVYFILKYGKSAVEDMSIIASKGIYNATGEVLFVPRNTSEMMGKYVKEDLDSRITTIFNDTKERNYFLKEIVDNILTTPGKEPSIDHSKYYGMPNTAADFIHNKFYDIRIPIDSLKTQYNFYISGPVNTGDSIGKIYIPRLNRIQLELRAITRDLKMQKLKFKGANINEVIKTQSGNLQNEISDLEEEMNGKLASIAGEKESSGGKKTRRRKATSFRRVSLRKRKSKRDKRSNQSKGTLKKKHSKKHKA
jgi:hypothetical protein